MTVRSALLAGVWCVAAVPAAPAVAADNPTFTRDVAPILRTHCTDCHRG